jgi:hypothetical protein
MIKNIRTSSKLIHYGLLFITSTVLLVALMPAQAAKPAAPTPAPAPKPAAAPKPTAAPAVVPATASKPNIIFIMGDDIGVWNIGAYHRNP